MSDEVDEAVDLELRRRRMNGVVAENYVWDRDGLQRYLSDDELRAQIVEELRLAAAKVRARHRSPTAGRGEELPAAGPGEGLQGAIPEATKPVPQHRAQEEAILAKLIELGYEPTALPPWPNGKPSPARRAIWAALSVPPWSYSQDKLKKAWQRLRNDGRIAEQPSGKSAVGALRPDGAALANVWGRKEA